MEKQRVVMTNSFFPAGRYAKIIKDTRGRKTCRRMISFLVTGKGEVNIERDSTVKIASDWMKFKKRLGCVRSYLPAKTRLNGSFTFGIKS